MKKISIGKQVKVGPNCSIGACVIGDRVQIGRAVIIEDGCSIGADTTIKSGCILGRDSSIGENVVLEQGVIVCERAKISDKKKVKAGSVVRK